MSLLIVAIIIGGVAICPLFILLGMRIHHRERTRSDGSPARLLAVAILILLAFPLIHQPRVAREVLKTRIPISAFLGTQEAPETGARFCTPEDGCDTLAFDNTAIGPGFAFQLATSFMAQSNTEVLTKALGGALNALQAT